MSGTSNRRALLIAGPTASGKSAMALDAARRRNGVVINADALQVYAELRILTARPTVEDETLAPHALYGHVSGREPYSVGRWLADVRVAIETAWGADRLPIIAGGTGLYFRALEQGLADVPAIDPEIRNHWRNFGGDVHAELARLDPEAARRLAANDRQRIVRALEVVQSTGHTLAHWQKVARNAAVLCGVEVQRKLVLPPVTELYERAEARLDRMMADGALREVAPLADWDPGLPMMKAIGVPELAAYTRGEISLAEAVVKAKTATRHYIKRQFTWWRGQGGTWACAPLRNSDKNGAG